MDATSPQAQTEEWRGELQTLRGCVNQEIAARADEFADPLKERRMRMAVTATHCLESADVRLLFDDAIRSTITAYTRGELAIAAEKMRIAKMAVDTLGALQTMERKAYRLEDTPVPMPLGDLQQVGQVVFTIQQARVREDHDAYANEGT